MKTNGHCTAAGDLNFRQIFVDNPTFSRINDVCTFGGIKNGHNEEKDVSVDVDHGLVIVVVDGGQAFHVDVDTETVLASVISSRDRPGSPEKDFSSSSSGLHRMLSDFKRLQVAEKAFIFIYWLKFLAVEYCFSRPCWTKEFYRSIGILCFFKMFVVDAQAEWWDKPNQITELFKLTQN